MKFHWVKLVLVQRVYLIWEDFDHTESTEIIYWLPSAPWDHFSRIYSSNIRRLLNRYVIHSPGTGAVKPLPKRKGLLWLSYQCTLSGPWEKNENLFFHLVGLFRFGIKVMGYLGFHSMVLIRWSSQFCPISPSLYGLPQVPNKSRYQRGYSLPNAVLVSNDLWAQMLKRETWHVNGHGTKKGFVK